MLLPPLLIHPDTEIHLPAGQKLWQVDKFWLQESMRQQHRVISPTCDLSFPSLAAGVFALSSLINFVTYGFN